MAVMAAALTSLSVGSYVSSPKHAVTAYEGKALTKAAPAVPQSTVDRNAELSAQVISYRTLSHDWDGDGGVVPNEKTIGAALSFIDLLPLDAEPNASMVEGSGDIGFYWDTESAYIDITFDGDEIVYFAKVVQAIDQPPFVARGREAFDGRYMPSNLLTAISMA